jgi:2-hydroxycyclohexanecarboxyl-CoA dehydrogenase
MDLGLEGRTVIVTGGASNIGRGIVLGFAAEGAAVYLADIDVPQANRVAKEAAGPGEVLVHETDVTDPEAVRRLVARAVAERGRVDVLVNNAGWAVDRLFVEQQPAEWERILATELWSFLHCTRAVLDPMIERRYGRIVSIGSDAGRIGEWREVVHSGAKAAVMAMTRAIAREVGKHNITLNVVSPGFTPGRPETSGERSIWAGEQGGQFPADVLEKVARRYPLRRLGSPDDIVPAVLLLASDRASYVTGQTLSVSGGYTMF